MADHKYTADTIKSLDWKEHIRLRPGMYIGKLGDGSSEDDGIYVLLKEVLDNSIDEFVMGYGKQIEVECDGQVVTVRDFGRGIPLEKLLDCSSKINTGAKYDSEAFKKSVGLNGVGIKAVNALSNMFEIQAFREGETRRIEFAAGEIQSIDKKNKSTKEENGTTISYVPDESMFKKYRYRNEYVERMLRYYTYLNRGLTIRYNGKRFRSKDGLKDLLEENISEMSDLRIESLKLPPEHLLLLLDRLLYPPVFILLLGVFPFIMVDLFTRLIIVFYVLLAYFLLGYDFLTQIRESIGVSVFHTCTYSDLEHSVLCF